MLVVGGVRRCGGGDLWPRARASAPLVAERFGGQVLDTMSIENFISIQHTEGPRMVQQMEAHVDQYGVDVMTLQRADKLVAARSPGGLHELHLESGATLRARTLILSTGARWRQMNVPGEDAYRNKGVTYCPHCDGPLFRGKRVAVIGGGNSGVERGDRLWRAWSAMSR